ncbi:MAG: hypothetical protein VX325_05845 [Bacteroidota bacterium]|nr:hypothetical protein [Bacteroidota bacterium]
MRLDIVVIGIIVVYAVWRIFGKKFFPSMSDKVVHISRIIFIIILLVYFFFVSKY